jgi:hypothetical protein
VNASPGHTRTIDGRQVLDRRRRLPRVVVLTALGALLCAGTFAAGPAGRASAQAEPSWTPLGGAVDGDPAVVADPQDPNGVYVFVRGNDAAMYWGHLANGVWSGYTPAGGVLSSLPYAVVDRTGVTGSTGIYVFGRGADGALYTGLLTLDGVWHGWQGLGGYLSSFPTATVTESGLWVGARGGDDAFYAINLDHGSWSTWSGYGGYLTSAPWMASAGPEVDAFASGGDNGLYALELTTASWAPLGGSVTSAPVALPGPDGISVLVRGTDGAAYRRHGHAGDWAPYEPLGGYLTSAPFAAANADGISVYVRGGDGAAYRTRSDGTAWSPWTSLGGYLTSDPTPVVDDAGVDHVFVTGGDGQLYTYSAPH